MAQKPLREAQAKALVDAYYPGSAGKPLIRFAAVSPETKLGTLAKGHAWLTLRQAPDSAKATPGKQGDKLVVKVDELFGKRGKLGYVKIAKNWTEARKWIEGLRGKEITLNHRTGTVEHFIIEPFIEHTVEYYLAFTQERDCDVILFSKEGGVEVEDAKAPPMRIEVPLGSGPLEGLAGGKGPDPFGGVPKEIRATIQGLFALWRSLDMAFLEINPLTVADGNVYLLDAVCRVDTCAAQRQHHTWSNLDVPEGFGTVVTPEERAIRDLDEKTGASLKFVLLHPKGRIWTMVAGGGASIVYADAITAQAEATELANYGEWSGNPTADEMEAYTGNILRLMTSHPGDRHRFAKRNGASPLHPKALIIGGGIANFTDIAVTFTGVIRALRKYASRLGNVRIYVRRAGPNDTLGLKAIQNACDELGIWCTVHGAEMPMTEVVKMAVKDLGLPKGSGPPPTKGSGPFPPTGPSRGPDPRS